MPPILAGSVFFGLAGIFYFCGKVPSCKAGRADEMGKGMGMDRIGRIKATMRRFETAINTADARLIEELVCEDAPFFTPASHEPLYGGKGYLSIVLWMRAGFSDVQWKLEDMVADEEKAAVRWTLTGTHDGDFLGLAATGTRIKTTMNFYYFNEAGKIINDVAADGMIGILRPLGLSK